MFTGLIRSLGVVQNINDRQLEVVGVNFPFALGDSIAVNGVCLTVSYLIEGGFGTDVSPETRRRTNLGYLKAGNRVNLEPSLAVGDKIGGHFVTGHVDGLGTLRSMTLQGNSWWLDFAVPPHLQKYLAEKGSIAVNGVSLTIATCHDGFQVAVIPHTFYHTNLQHVNNNVPVNLEMDILAKYVESLLKFKQPTASLTTEFLQEHGYL
ncbi:MAG: riboflavin synthase [Pseudanabaenaceae cyanobacterium SKYGB_i_bin29]|nr:riboflavin synthase [Pseudanabaenaceae cyanobacterium SKYG29]MDW8421376.1 riboflavin synthase [Pseudanabaenaceae cyanobacterium SKYGB_i_bin29]